MKELDRLSKIALRVKRERDALIAGICKLADEYAQAGETVGAYKAFAYRLRGILADAGITIPRYRRRDAPSSPHPSVTGTREPEEESDGSDGPIQENQRP